MIKLNKLILSVTTLMLFGGLTLSNALANAPVPEEVTEAAKQTTGDMAKQAATEVTDSAKEKAIVVAKEQADKVVDKGVEKATEVMNPTDKAADVAKEVTK